MSVVDPMSRVTGFDRPLTDESGFLWKPPVPTSSRTGGSTAEQDTLHSLGAVQRLLIQAIARGSDRDVMSAFAESLAVCEDIEVRAYVETLNGRFQLEVALAGSDPDAAPSVIGADGLPEGVAFARLASADIERLRFTDTEDVIVARVGDPAHVPWLITLSGIIPVEQEARILVYVELLDQALRTVLSQTAVRASWAILEHLLPGGDRVEPAAQAALAALSSAVGGAGAALVVTMLTGMHVFSLGDADVFSVPRPYGEADEIVSTTRILDRYSMTLAVRRLDGVSFTRRERYLLDVASPIFTTWLTGVLQQPSYGKDRRGAPPRFDDVVERVAARAIDEGASLSVVLFRLTDGAVRGPAVRRWVSQVRGQLRPTDLAGLVSESEVAVLLTDTGPEHARVVVDRIRQRVDSDEELMGVVPLSVGIASCSAEQPIRGSVLRAAREDAARRTAV
jgi:hypothetical protein